MNPRLAFAFAAMLLLGLLTASADNPSAAPSPPPTSALSAPVTDPALISARFQQMLTRPKFQETGEPDVKSRFKQWLSRWFMRFGSHLFDFKYANNVQALTSLFLTVMIGLSIVGLIYTMVRLTRRRARIEPESSPRLSDPKTFQPPEFYELEIQHAIRQGNWHAAWLASWRQFLSRLEMARLVEADRTRTNREYLAQLRTQSLPASAFTLLAAMVDAYDRFIYGRQAIARPDWELFHAHLNEAVLLLHLNDHPATSATPEPRP